MNALLVRLPIFYFKNVGTYLGGPESGGVVGLLVHQEPEGLPRYHYRLVQGIAHAHQTRQIELVADQNFAAGGRIERQGLRGFELVGFFNGGIGRGAAL